MSRSVAGLSLSLARQHVENSHLKKELARLKKALQFYAKIDNWSHNINIPSGVVSKVELDMGYRAANALRLAPRYINVKVFNERVLCPKEN